MLHSAKIFGALVAGAALSRWPDARTTAPPPPMQPAATTGPELAGAWYQVYFDTNSAAINTRGKAIVEKVAYVVANNCRYARDGHRQDRSGRHRAAPIGSVRVAGERSPRCADRRRRAVQPYRHELDRRAQAADSNGQRRRRNTQPGRRYHSGQAARLNGIGRRPKDRPPQEPLPRLGVTYC